MHSSIFRAYDIRGRYPDEVNEKAVFEISCALGKFFGQQASKLTNHQASVVVAHDARLSSPSLYKAVLKGLNSDKKRKLKIIKVGLATTPMLYFLANHYKANGGIMVTASHNPKEYNGLKVIKDGKYSVGGLEILRIVNRK